MLLIVLATAFLQTSSASQDPSTTFALWKRAVACRVHLERDEAELVRARALLLQWRSASPSDYQGVDRQQLRAIEQRRELIETIKRQEGRILSENYPIWHEVDGRLPSKRDLAESMHIDYVELVGEYKTPDALTVELNKLNCEDFLVLK